MSVKNEQSALRKTDDETVDVINFEKGETTSQKVRNTLTEELIFGICAPIGSKKETVIKKLTKLLKEEYNYKEVKEIKISDFIDKFGPKGPESHKFKTEGYTTLINKIKGGNSLREKFTPEVLAEFAIKDMRVDREEDLPNRGGNELVAPHEFKTRRVCYIIDSIKNLNELKLLRAVYNSSFYSFSILSPLQERKDNLLARRKLAHEEVEELVSIDEFENKNEGQNVRDTFVEGDFIVRVSESNLNNLEEKLKRYLNLIFDSAVVTPLPNEIAMYEAKSSAGNSACLSRQVGATITNSVGEIISRGWNDVPKFGGNLYKSEDLKDDNRCFKLGYCSNDRTKNNIAKEITNLLLKNKNLEKKIGVNENEALANSIENIIRKSSKIKDLIEFSRSVHAEMHAIIIGSQLAGDKMIGGKLFCTTYPCHNCARHIIAAGIMEIYYIEPYVKSLCTELHSDAITEDENSNNKVKILVYDGVAPRRFLEFFSMKNKRKNDIGDLVIEKNANFSPKSQISLQAVPTLEDQAILSLKEKGLLNGD